MENNSTAAVLEAAYQSALQTWKDMDNNATARQVALAVWPMLDIAVAARKAGIVNPTWFFREKNSRDCLAAFKQKRVDVSRVAPRWTLEVQA